jgi:hypothetical protein
MATTHAGEAFERLSNLRQKLGSLTQQQVKGNCSNKVQPGRIVQSSWYSKYEGISNGVQMPDHCRQQASALNQHVAHGLQVYLSPSIPHQHDT